MHPPFEKSARTLSLQETQVPGKRSTQNRRCKSNLTGPLKRIRHWDRYSNKKTKGKSSVLECFARFVPQDSTKMLPIPVISSVTNARCCHITIVAVFTVNNTEESVHYLIKVLSMRQPICQEARILMCVVSKASFTLVFCVWFIWDPFTQ